MYDECMMSDECMMTCGPGDMTNDFGISTIFTAHTKNLTLVLNG